MGPAHSRNRVGCWFLALGFLTLAACQTFGEGVSRNAAGALVEVWFAQGKITESDFVEYQIRHVSSFLPPFFAGLSVLLAGPLAWIVVRKGSVWLKGLASIFTTQTAGSEEPKTVKDTPMTKPRRNRK